jgi:biopolymer transport protein ExbD
MSGILARRFVSPISNPGRRLLRHVPLRFIKQRLRGGQRQLGFELPLISFVDCLLCVIAFLLASFSADAQSADRQRVPSAENAQANISAPVVAVTQGQILVDGVPAASTPAIVHDARLTRIDALFDQLRSKRKLWRQLHPSEEFPGVVVLQIDRQVPSLVVKSAFQTAAYAGYPNVSFLVKKR